MAIYPYLFIWLDWVSKEIKAACFIPPNAANYQPCLNNPIAKELFWPGYIHSLAQLLLPFYPPVPVDFS